jgi:hypothetical protein
MPNEHEELARGQFVDPVRVNADVSLKRSATTPTEDQPLWVAIRNRTQAISFKAYYDFINKVLCEGQTDPESPPFPQTFYGAPSVSVIRAEINNRPTIHGVDAYHLLKMATEAFLLFECGVKIEEHNNLGVDLFDPLAEGGRLGRGEPVTVQEISTALTTYLTGNPPKILPYLDRIVNQIVSLNHAEGLPYCQKILQYRLTCPSLLELIWSYWHEEGMLVQTMNAIALRFQNKRLGWRDPLANLELDPLRPLNNIIWGFVQDEYNRLSVQRRAYEYCHQYGFTLVGKAVRRMQAADSRSQFVGAFHNLLYRAAEFFQQDNVTTIIADGFPLLNALREVHIILAQGAHNEFSDLPWTARREMLIMQWILARAEIREFLRGRYMVPYQEPWMGAVDDMKRLQGWSDVTITHFHELAIFGEQLLLSIRYGDWIDINDQNFARNWARYWRPEIQRYIHAYHAVTGVDLAADIVNTRRADDRYLQPSMLLSKRLAASRSRAALPRSSTAREPLRYEATDYAKLSSASRARLPQYRGDD